MQSIGAAGPLDSLFGVPTHPLAAAVASVLLAMAALGAIMMALSPRWCRRFGILIWPLIGVATLLCVVAAASGEALARHGVAPPAQHARLGAQLKYLGAALIVVAFVLWLLDHRTRGPRPVSVKILAAVVAVIAVMAIVWTVRVGDSGARQVWAPKLQQAAAGFPAHLVTGTIADAHSTPSSSASRIRRSDCSLCGSARPVATQLSSAQ